MHLTSYVKNPVDHYTDNGREYFTVQTIGPLKSAFLGRGIVYSWVDQVGENATMNSQFEMREITSVRHVVDESSKITVELDAKSRFPCSGIISSTGEGYAIGLAFKLEPAKGPNIVLMLISPRSSPLNVSVEKSVLAIPNEESRVIVTTDGGDLRCLGEISDQSKRARIVLNRNPRLPVYRAGFNETLFELKGRGKISAVWKPVARSFEELLLAFHPSSMGSFNSGSMSLHKIADYFGVNSFANTRKLGDFVIGDGVGVNYTLRLRLGRGLGRRALDETRLTIN